ncbi:MAG TPA: hypothetical protein VIS74_07455, partial [Chthoniobacterales bacterium]
MEISLVKLFTFYDYLPVGIVPGERTVASRFASLGAISDRLGGRRWIFVRRHDAMIVEAFGAKPFFFSSLKKRKRRSHDLSSASTGG